MTYVEGKEQNRLSLGYTMTVKKKARTSAYAAELICLALKQNSIQEQDGQAFGNLFQIM
jgi:hypothetical protein